jgi:PAS domain S-box-containing protein
MIPINQPMNLPVLEQVIDPSPITVSPDTPLIEVISCMGQAASCHCTLPCYDLSMNTGMQGQHLSSCVLVVERSRLVGICTERDVVRLTASAVDLHELRMTDVMTQPVITMPLSNSATILSALEIFNQHQIRHLPVVTEDQGELMGIITQASLLRRLDPLKIARIIETQQDFETGTAELEQTNQCLEQEILEPRQAEVLLPDSDRKQMELQLRSAQEALASQVQQSTQALTEINEQLNQEINEKEQYIFEKRRFEADREQMRIVLQQNEEQLRLALELNHIGLWVWYIASDVVTWNDNHYRLLGFQPWEVEPSYQVWRDRVHPEDIMLVEEKLTQALENQTDYEAEFRIILKDGTTRWLLSKGRGIYNELAQPVRMIGVLFDITDRKQAEAQQAFQASLLNQVQNAVIATDLEGRVTYWNQFAQQLYQLTPEDMGRSILEVTVLVKQQEIAQEVMASIQTMGRWEGEFEVQRRDGSTFTAYVIDSLIRDQVGNPCGIVGISTDITAQKQLEAQFLRAQRLESLGTLASGIAHDLNNILTPMLAMASLLPLNLPPLSERSQQLLNMMNENAKRGANLVKQILTFARGLEGERAPVQIKHLLRELVQVIHSTFPKSITITRNIATEDLWLVSADATQLHQVFMNFCVNARDAMPEGGTLTLSAENKVVDEMFAQMHLDAKAGSYVAITFADTGIGIAPEHIDRIFEPFFTTKVVGKGTGLGLSTVLGIIKNHGGFVTVSSKVGQGTEFQVFLPAIASSETPTEVHQELSMGKGELILIADDEENIRETLKLSLENQNYRVLTAKDGIDAISIYAAHQSDIQAVLIDMMMPSMGGTTAIPVLKRLNPQIKIIACSGTENQDNLGNITGIKAFLSKPFTINDLLSTLQTILSKE